jgi:hypothetical protein
MIMRAACCSVWFKCCDEDTDADAREERDERDERPSKMGRATPPPPQAEEEEEEEEAPMPMLMPMTGVCALLQKACCRRRRFLRKLRWMTTADFFVCLYLACSRYAR